MPENINLWVDNWVPEKLTGLNKSHDKRVWGTALSLSALVSNQVLQPLDSYSPFLPSGCLSCFSSVVMVSMSNGSHRIMCKSIRSPPGSTLWEVEPNWSMWVSRAGVVAVVVAVVVRFVTQSKSSPICVLVQGDESEQLLHAPATTETSLPHHGLQTIIRSEAFLLLVWHLMTAKRTMTNIHAESAFTSF